MVTQFPEAVVRELDHRIAAGVEVTLFWNSQTDAVFVTVVDELLDVTFEFDVAPGDALYAFHHPYSYTERVHGDRLLPA